jgi:MOSC domain-containing protein
MMEQIGTVETICRYPVKSMAGEEVGEAFVGFAGVMGDRTYAFTYEQAPPGFPWFTGREQEDLILYRPHFRDGDASRLPPNVEASFRMPPGVFAAYPDANAFSVSVTTPDGRTYAIDSAELKAELEAKSGAKVRLHFSERSQWDCRPVSLFGNSSVFALAQELKRTIDRRRFRANFYADWNEPNPYREDDLVGRTLQIGERLKIAVLERDPRCKMITLDPDTGEQDSEVLRHVTKTRGGKLGVYGAVLVEGVARKGEPIALV